MFDHLKWAVENRVVREPVWALFADRADAEDYADEYMEARVFPAKEVGDDGFRVKECDHQFAHTQLVCGNPRCRES